MDEKNQQAMLGTNSHGIPAAGCLLTCLVFTKGVGGCVWHGNNHAFFLSLSFFLFFFFAGGRTCVQGLCFAFFLYLQQGRGGEKNSASQMLSRFRHSRNFSHPVHPHSLQAVAAAKAQERPRGVRRWVQFQANPAGRDPWEKRRLLRVRRRTGNGVVLHDRKRSIYGKVRRPAPSLITLLH
jgi:hypothetical protein